MTQERVTLHHEVLPAFYEQLQTHPLYIDLTPGSSFFGTGKK
jgi:hypothetical protein